jgi:hypothetical protein
MTKQFVLAALLSPLLLLSGCMSDKGRFSTAGIPSVAAQEQKAADEAQRLRAAEMKQPPIPSWAPDPSCADLYPELQANQTAMAAAKSYGEQLDLDSKEGGLVADNPNAYDAWSSCQLRHGRFPPQAESVESVPMPPVIIVTPSTPPLSYSITNFGAAGSIVTPLQ